MNNYDVIIVGAGFAGSTVANKLANKGKKVLVLEKRNHIGGNAYDYEKDNILVHEYGPHIFHTNSKEVYDYLCNFSDFYHYEHRVLGHIQGKVVPIPFNLKSIDDCFDQNTAEELKTVLINEYGEGKKVPIMELRQNDSPKIKELAEFIFENVFKHYTMKQWGLEAEEIDPAVTARVPVNVSYDDRYFNDTYQYMPSNGYTYIFKRMLDHPNIEVRLNEDARKHLSFDFYNNKILFNKEEFNGEVVYTGAVDELLYYKLGDLPYRSLDLKLSKHEGTYQMAATENYPDDKNIHAFTRISEYKLFTKDKESDVTYIHTEYPMAYDKDAQVGNIPYYPIFTQDNQKKYDSYVEILRPFTNLHLLGRLAEYKYYNMDAIILKALELSEKLI